MDSGDKVAGYRDPVSGGSQPDAIPGAARVPPAAAPEIGALLKVVVAVVVVAGLYFGQEVLVPITLAVMLSFLLSPVVNRLRRWRVPRAAAVMLTVLMALGVLGLVGTLIGSQAASLTADAPRYAKTIQNKVEGVKGYAVGELASITGLLGSRPAPHGATPATGARNAAAPAVAAAGSAAARPMPVQVVNDESSPFTIVRSILAPVLGPLETFAIVLVVAIFVLLQKEDLRDRCIRVFGSRDLHRTTLAMDDAGQRLSRYFLSQFGVNTGFGIVIGLGLWLIGIPSPAMWGILAGMLRFVPYIGSALAAIAPMALGAAIEPGWTMTIEVALLFVVIEPVVGYVVEPLLYGHSTGLSPVSVIVAAVFWTWLWGPIGLILSTPLTLILVVLGRYVKSLEVFDVLLGDRPALTAVEQFYQRILADDPDEALAQAETLLGDRPLAGYYDEVVLAGLKLAAADAERGTIDGASAARIARSMRSVIDDLAGHALPGQEAATYAASGEVACIAGRGAFDEAVTAMLAQLLGQDGFQVRQIGNAAVSRDALPTLDLSGVRVIAVSYLELAGSPAHLRFLVRRLRQRAPEAAIVVGLWPEGDGAGSEEERRSVGADRYAGSLAEAAGAVRELLAVEAPARAA